MKIKRFIAYIIDILLVSILSSAVFMLPCFSKQYNYYNRQTSDVVDRFLTIGSGDTDIEEMNKIAYDLSKSSVSLSVITIGITFVYFGVFQFCRNGQTIGKKLMKIRIVSINSNKLQASLFIFREVILHNVLFKIISIVIILQLSFNNYMKYNPILSYLQFFVSMAVIGFLIFRTDERGLHDLLCKTKVVEEEK